jgi:Phage integrase family
VVPSGAGGCPPGDAVHRDDLLGGGSGPERVRRAGRLHDVRYSHATAALAAGIPAKVVSERLGHATIAITLDVYSHVIPGMDAQAANAVASLILGDPAQAKGPDRSPGRPLTKRQTCWSILVAGEGFEPSTSGL